MFSSFTNSPFFVTVVCLILAYALLSLLVSTVTEMVNSYFNERGRQLYKVISKLFDDGINVNFGQLMYNHPMLANLKKDINTLPQYISNPMFSQVLMDVVGNYARVYQFNADQQAIQMQETVPDPFDRFLAGVRKMEHTDLKLLLLNMAEKSLSLAGTDPSRRLENLDSQIQQWYGDQMDRVSGWFKDLMRGRVRLIALLVTLALNVNSIALFEGLYRSPQLQSQLYPIAAQLADNYAKQASDTTLSAQQKELKALYLTHLRQGNADSLFGPAQNVLRDLGRLDSLAGIRDSQRTANFQQLSDQLGDIAGLGLPLGWRRNLAPLNWSGNAATVSHQSLSQKTWILLGRIGLYALGLAITAFSISVGAPFWFDMLLKLVNIRRAGKKPGDN